MDQLAAAEPNLQDLRQARRTMHMLFGAFFFIFLGAGAQQLYIAGYLERCTGWSALMRGLVVAVLYSSMMVFRVANVYLLRRWSDWQLTFIGSLTYTLFTLAMLGTFWLPSYPLVLLAAAVWGWGAAAMWAGTTMQVLAATDVDRGRYGTNQGSLYAATDGGWLAGTILLGMIHAHTAWPPYTLYLVAAAVTVVGNVMTWYAPRTDSAPHSRPTVRDLLVVSSRAKVRIAGFLLCAASVSFGLMLGVFRDWVEHQHGPQYLWIASMFYPGARFLLRFAGGSLTDRKGHSFVLTTSFLVGAAGMALAAHWQTVVAAAIAALTLGLLNGSVPVVASAMVGDSADRQRRPLAYGALFVWRDVGVVAAAIWGQVLMRQGGDFAQTFTSFAAVFAVCGLVALLLKRYADERL